MIEPRKLATFNVSDLKAINNNASLSWTVQLLGNMWDSLLIQGQKPSGSNNGIIVVQGRLSNIPGSGLGPLVSNSLSVHPTERGKGYSKQYDHVIKEIAGLLGRWQLIANIKRDNTIQVKRLTQLGWTQISPNLFVWKPSWFDEMECDNENSD